MSQTAIATEIHEPLDAHGHITPKITFDFVRAVDHLSDFGDIHFTELIRLRVRIEARFFQYFP